LPLSRRDEAGYIIFGIPGSAPKEVLTTLILLLRASECEINLAPKHADSPRKVRYLDLTVFIGIKLSH
jgi:hypothetical protein